MNPCPVCKLPIVKSEYYPEGRCSEFCELSDESAILAFQSLKEGDWGLFPCSQCGVTIEDEYPATACFCSDCWPGVKLERTRQALEAVLVNMQTWKEIQGETGLPEDRCQEILNISKGKF